jgi:eukaryotic-like serine/threonine-protein kinase
LHGSGALRNDRLCSQLELARTGASDEHDRPESLDAIWGDLWQRVAGIVKEREIFVAALQVDDEQERSEFLDRACADNAELRKRVEELLKAFQQAGSFLQHPATELEFTKSDWDQCLSIRPGSRVGRYRIREKIGEGGFGVVYVAEQEEPVRRKVALKLIKPGMDTREVIARFEAERQALALMDHPHVARVLDAGATELGQPFFVMELVHGLPITHFCDHQKLSLEQRLELFSDVCRAVQHAHQKGIIHRDLKPSNVMVALRDGKPMVKVIDFGVAKALHYRLTDKTVYTRFGQMIGTPVYMSPEQAETGGLDIDTRSDIYALGILLYQLLTGTPPFDPQSLEQASFDEVRRIIRDVEPERPSVRISTFQDDRLSTMADNRQIQAEELHRKLRGDLDWIVMKAIEKDRSRRYHSAAGLADDISRFLKHEPVVARPPSTGYVLRKLYRRYQLVVTMTLLLALVFILGAGLAIWQAVRARVAEQLAVEERDRAIEVERHNQELLYAADLRRAEGAWHNRDATQMREALSLHVPRPGERDRRGFEWYFLWNQQEAVSREIFQGDDPLYALAVSPNGKLLAAGGLDGMLRLFDADHGHLLHALDSQQSELNDLAFSSDGRWLASTGDDGTVVVRDAVSLRVRWRVKAHQGLAFGVVFTPDGGQVISCGDEPDARIWDAETGTARGRLSSDGISLENVDISPRGIVVLGGKMGASWIYASDYDLMAARRGPSGDALLEFSPSGRLLAESQPSGIVSLYAADKLEHPRRRFFLPDTIRSLAFSPDEQILAAGDSSGAVHLLPLRDPEPLDAEEEALDRREAEAWQAHEGRVYAVAFSANGQSLITAGEDGQIRAWSLQRATMRRLEGITGTSLAFDREGALVVAAADGLHRVSRKEVSRSARLGNGGSWWIDVAQDADVAFAITSSQEVRRLSSLLEDQGTVWNSQDGKTANWAAVSPQGRRLGIEVMLPVQDQRALELWDLDTMTLLTSKHCRAMNAMEFSPDGEWLACAEAHQVHLFETRTGRLRHSLDAHRTTIKGISFSPQGKYLATVSHDRTLKVWHIESARPVWSTVAHRASGQGVDFSADGETLATCGEDGKLRLWRWRIERLVLEIPVPVRKVREVRFSPDSRHLALRGSSGEVYLLDASPRETVAVNQTTPESAGPHR